MKLLDPAQDAFRRCLHHAEPRAFVCPSQRAGRLLQQDEVAELVVARHFSARTRTRSSAPPPERHPCPRRDRAGYGSQTVGAAPQAISAAGREDPGFRLVPRSPAGDTRFLAAMGAESYKVEWKEQSPRHPPRRRWRPLAGARHVNAATGPLPGVKDPDMGGQFNNKNAGKRGISLNIRHPKGLQIAKDLVRICDIVAEGFSPGVLQRLGLGYEVMKKIRPDIIYIQQAGMGAHGTYGRMRTVGPVAAAFSGQAEMSGLPEPAMPVGWGYSYLDWMGAYGYALALLGALYHRDRTGEGQWIDASQCESGLFLTGTSILDWSANGRVWSRYGNRSPYKPAAPHGAYRCQGADRWVAIACFTDDEFQALARIAGTLDDRRFATPADRLAHQDVLDEAVSAWTKTRSAEEIMMALQHAGVPAGVCQNAEDRCDNDPQLRHLNWLTEITGTKIGTWPVYELPMKLSRTPAYIGGPINRGAPGYGEDNSWVLTNLLGMTPSDLERLSEEGVI